VRGGVYGTGIGALLLSDFVSGKTARDYSRMTLMLISVQEKDWGGIYEIDI
jgi:hypothetical protein